MRVRTPAWLAIATIVGCANPRQTPSEESGAAATAPAAADSVERGALGFVHEGDTTVIDEYTRTATVLEGVVRPQVAGAKFGWARYRVEFGASGDAERAVLELGRRGTSPESSPPGGTWTVTIRDGQVEEVGPNGERRRVRADAPVIPLFSPSMAMFLEVPRRAHRGRSAGGRMRLLVYPLASNGVFWPVIAEWPAPDTVAVRYEGRAPRFYAVDPRGRVLGMRNDRDVVRVR